jgi:lysophospholipase L1-like esterase
LTALTGWRGLALELALALCAILVAVSVCEMAVRVFLRPPPMIRFSALAEAVDAPGGGGHLDDVFQRDADRFWRLAPNVRFPDDGGALVGVISNSRGLRDPREIPFDKPPDAVRILFLGDSTTFGWLLRYDETIVHQTEQRLRERFPGRDIACLNAGVPGYTAFQGWRFLETEGLLYQPDLVVASFGFNDSARWQGRGDLEVHRHDQLTRPAAGLRWSRLARLAWNAFHPWPQHGVHDSRPRLLPEEFREVLGRIEATTKRRGVDLLLLVGALRINVDGSKEAGYRRPLQYEQVAFGRNIAFGPGSEEAYVDGVRVLRDLAKEHTLEEIFLDHVHPTALANRAMADALAEKITPWMLARSAD